jgi:hypothetical protein
VNLAGLASLILVNSFNIVSPATAYFTYNTITIIFESVALFFSICAINLLYIKIKHGF